MHHCVFLILYITSFFSFSGIIGPNKALNPKKQPAYKTIQFNTNWYLTNSSSNINNNNSNTGSSSVNTTTTVVPVPIRQILEPNYFKNEEYILYKNIYRAQNYGKSSLSGIKDFRKIQTNGIQLGFKSYIPNIEEDIIPKKLVCYYNIPSVYDIPYPVFPEQIDPFMCTHILIAFGRVYNYTLIPSDPRDVEFYTRTTRLKLKNPNLKIMMSVGSTNDGSIIGQQFVNMMMTNETRGKFIHQSIILLKSYGFDGIDIDWEFPGYNGPMEQKQQLTNLLIEFKNYINNNNNKSIEFLISIAVPAPKDIIDIGYDIQGIAGVVDFINLMSYDYHYYSTYSPIVGPNSPLYNLTNEYGFFATLNLAWSAKYWYQNGMPANKIIVGIPLYGHSYTLIDERYHDYYSLAGGYGTLGQNGFVPYVPICKFIENGAQSIFNNETKEPYAYRGKQWVSYDNQQSVQQKAKFIKTMNFGGAMFYSLNCDDAWKICKTSKTTFPLISQVKRELEPDESFEFLN